MPSFVALVLSLPARRENAPRVLCQSEAVPLNRPASYRALVGSVGLSGTPDRSTRPGLGPSGLAANESKLPISRVALTQKLIFVSDKNAFWLAAGVAHLRGVADFRQTAPIDGVIWCDEHCGHAHGHSPQAAFDARDDLLALVGDDPDFSARGNDSVACDAHVDCCRSPRRLAPGVTDQRLDPRGASASIVG